MRQLIILTAMLTSLVAFSACGDKKDTAARDQEAQKVLQEGAQKEKAMMEGMQKGVENIEKKLTDQKEDTKK